MYTEENHNHECFNDLITETREIDQQDTLKEELIRETEHSHDSDIDLIPTIINNKKQTEQLKKELENYIDQTKEIFKLEQYKHKQHLTNLDTACIGIIFIISVFSTSIIYYL